VKVYFCSCFNCSWKGNKPHRDGQCPVCGHGLDIQVRKRRFSSDLSPRVNVSGLSTDDKLSAHWADFSLFNRFKPSDEDLNELTEAKQTVAETLEKSIPKVLESANVLKALELRFRGNDDS